MRKLKNKSITIIISMLLLFVGAFTWLTFSLSRADEYEDEAPGDTTVSNVKTNIDLIIQNSNDTEKEDSFRQYHSVEISSGAPASCKGFCEKASDNTTQFELLVLNEHRTKQMQNEAGQIIDTALFAPGYIDYKSFNLESLRSGATLGSEIDANLKPAVEAVVNADLIYISCDVTDDGNHVFAAKNDFNGELLNALMNYTTNDLKPVIIDSPTKVADDLYGSSKTFQYIGAAFGESGSARNTFAWQFDNTAGTLDPADAMSYFTRSLPSKYLPISGSDVESDKWIRVSYDGKEYNAAKILTVKANGGTNPITDKIKEGLGSEVTVTEVGGTKKWRWLLAEVVANNFRCKFYACGKLVTFYGHSTDIEVAKDTYEYLFKVAHKGACKERDAVHRIYGTSAGVYNGYCIGFVNGVKSALAKQCTALMLVTPKDVEESYADMSKSFATKRNSIHARGNKANIESAKKSGFEAGKDTMGTKLIG